MSMRTKLKMKMGAAKRKNELVLTLWLIGYSVIAGSFFLKHNDFLINRTEPYLQDLPTGWIGGALVVAAITHFYGVFADKNKIRYVSIIALAICLGTLTFLSVTYHLGSGYPDNSWINHGSAAVIAIIVAYKGVYRD